MMFINIIYEKRRLSRYFVSCVCRRSIELAANQTLEPRNEAERYPSNSSQKKTRAFLKKGIPCMKLEPQITSFQRVPPPLPFCLRGGGPIVGGDDAAKYVERPIPGIL